MTWYVTARRFLNLRLSDRERIAFTLGFAAARGLPERDRWLRFLRVVDQSGRGAELEVLVGATEIEAGA